MSLESAIPRHLRSVAPIPRKHPEGFIPPAPARTARFDHTTTHVAMINYGLQYSSPITPEAAEAALADVERWADHSTDGPAHWDRSTTVDHAGYTTVLTTLYWFDHEAARRWQHSVPSWTDPTRYSPEVGFFTEAVMPPVARFETLLSSESREGFARGASHLSGEIIEHAYWGGARDRIPAAQTDELAPEGTLAFEDDGQLTVVRPHDNMCLIRSGQDWSDTRDDERKMYLTDVEPVLKTGMNFLSHQGQTIGCYSNRLVRVLDDGAETEHTFGLSWWRSLSDLEEWAKSHETHKAIFSAAMKHLGSLGPRARLRLYHEIVVASADDLEFEYLGCHPATGLLAARSHDMG